MSEPGYIFDAGYEAGIDSLTADIGKLQGDYDALLERYEKLEQMIRRMYRYIKKDADESWSPAKDKVAKFYREEIEALGVSVDD